MCCLLLPCGACLLVAVCVLMVVYAGPFLLDRVVVCGWLWLVCVVCCLLAMCADGCGVAVAVPVVHLHRFIVLHLTCLVGRIVFFC